MQVVRFAATASGLLLASVAATTSDSPVVAVKNGSYYGVYQSTYDQDLFLGVPFAQPPVGDLRWRNPEPFNSTWTNIKDATSYSPECYGYGSDTWVLGNVVSEDCLTLNVVRPSGISEGAELPVAVWIFGGGLTEGGSADPRYNLSYIVDEAARAGKPFIGVSINYRLQAFGFLWGTAVEEAGVANLGLKDQRLALQWVHENIDAFGGDPSKVTIWGESAGARSVGYQLVAYGGRDDKLFRGAIMESGSSAQGPSSFTNASTWDASYDKITAAANCSSAVDTLECLRQIPIDELSAVLNSSVTSSASWGPVIDGDFVEDAGLTLLSNGQFVHVPILHGTNHDEGTSFGKSGINTTDQFLEYLAGKTGSEDSAAVLVDLYPDIPAIGIPGTLHGRPGADTSYGAMYKRVCAYAGDNNQHAPRRLMSQVWATNNVPVYTYLFNVLTAGTSQYVGATHFTEVAFVFYNLLGNGYNTSVATDPFLNEPKTYAQLSRLMTQSWASFIVDQTPSHSGVTHLQWPQYTLDNQKNFVFDANVTELAYIEPDIYRAEAIKYIQGLFNATN